MVRRNEPPLVGTLKNQNTYNSQLLSVQRPLAFAIDVVALTWIFATTARCFAGRIKLKGEA